ncbi:hypothetical protein [Bacillus halotolerans]|uniref:hypothetical protein n=1 Tax=Bacillus halotolerans TaxID=260554 RepID=UPI000AD17EEA|nr:hypothetical protein [Bacillus halotolerans]
MTNLVVDFKKGSYINERVPNNNVKITHDQYDKWLLTSGLKKKSLMRKLRSIIKVTTIL